MSESGSTPGPDLPTRLDRVLYRLARLLGGCIQMVPLRGSLWLARRLGTLVFLLAGKHRRLAIDNLELALGDQLSERERSRWARCVFQSFMMSFIEGIHLPVLARSGRLAKLMEFCGPHDQLRELADRGPLLLLSGHLGSWEFLMGALQIEGVDMIGVMRPTPFPWMNAWMKDLRRETGQSLATKKGALADMRDAIRRGQSVGLLVDQHHRHGIMVDFFGTPARTNSVMGVLSQRFQLPIFLGYVERVVPGRRYRFVCEGPLAVETQGTRDERTHAITQQCTSIIEGFVRQAPRQWFWVHRRWRHVGRSSSESG